jgi:hypothetical protein
MVKAKAKQTKKRAWVYDVECYPNLFTATFRHVNSDEKRVFIIFDDRQNGTRHINQYKEFIAFLDNEVHTLVSYNGHSYDDTLLKHMINSRSSFMVATSKIIMDSVKTLSDLIIGQQRRRDDDDGTSSLPYLDALRQKKYFNSMDLMLQFNTIRRVPLKQLAINMRLPQIMDLPLAPDQIIEYSQINKIVDYNDIDVLATKALLEEREEVIKMRRDYSKDFDVNVLNQNDTGIAKVVIRKYYTETTGIRFEDYRKKRTPRYKLYLKECVSDKINFMSPPYWLLLNKIRNTHIDTMKAVKHLYKTIKYTTISGREEIGKEKQKLPDKQFEYDFQSKYINHTIGLGGIHSNNKSEIIEETEEYELIDADVASYYPAILVNERLYPGHLGPEFVSVYRDKIFYPRLEAKAKGQKAVEKGLKIALNSTFGLTMSPHSFLYDPHVTFSITISGQLFLLMLMERIELYTNAIVVYSNTDGLTCKVPKSEKALFYSVCQQWQEATGFKLEFVNFKRMIMRDVNNFLMVTKDPKNPIKVKGIFMNAYVDRPTPDWITQGYNYPVIANALQQYYTKGVKPEIYIRQQSDVYDFMRAARTSTKTFTVQFTDRSDKPQTMQKNNRWIVTHGNDAEGRLRKHRHPLTEEEKEKRLAKAKNYRKEMEIIKQWNNPIEMQKDRLVTILNDHTKPLPHISDYKLDFDFYISETYNIIKEIRPRSVGGPVKTYTQPKLL